MLDMNALISMAMFPSQRFGELLDYITKHHTLVLSSFVVEELEAVAERKFKICTFFAPLYLKRK